MFVNAHPLRSSSCILFVHLCTAICTSQSDYRSSHEPQVACETSVMLPSGGSERWQACLWTTVKGAYHLEAVRNIKHLYDIHLQYMQQICKATKLRFTGLPSLFPTR